jgi:hypothetical protein
MKINQDSDDLHDTTLKNNNSLLREYPHPAMDCAAAMATTFFAASRHFFILLLPSRNVSLSLTHYGRP